MTEKKVQILSCPKALIIALGKICQQNFFHRSQKFLRHISIKVYVYGSAWLEKFLLMCVLHTVHCNFTVIGKNQPDKER